MYLHLLSNDQFHHQIRKRPTKWIVKSHIHCINFLRHIYYSKTSSIKHTSKRVTLGIRTTTNPYNASSPWAAVPPSSSHSECLFFASRPFCSVPLQAGTSPAHVGFFHRRPRGGLQERVSQFRVFFVFRSPLFGQNRAFRGSFFGRVSHSAVRLFNVLGKLMDFIFRVVSMFSVRNWLCTPFCVGRNCLKTFHERQYNIRARLRFCVGISKINPLVNHPACKQVGEFLIA